MEETGEEQKVEGEELWQSQEVKKREGQKQGDDSSVQDRDF